jgi:hypothetical protein
MNPSRPAAFLRRLLALAACCALLGPAARAADEPRFSNTLSAAQRAESGLAQLSDDNVAVIDALVRQDEAAAKRRNGLIGPGRFSMRRTEHERDIAGLAKLTPAQLERLDDLIAPWVTVAPPQLSAEIGSPAPALLPEARERTPEVHGSVSLTYGWSKGGNVRGGDLVLTYADPAHHFAVLVEYSEYHGKGLAPPYPDPYLYPADALNRNRALDDYLLRDRAGPLLVSPEP